MAGMIFRGDHGNSLQDVTCPGGVLRAIADLGAFVIPIG